MQRFRNFFIESQAQDIKDIENIEYTLNIYAQNILFNIHIINIYIQRSSIIA